MKVEHWDAQRDGPLSEQALRSKFEGMGYRVGRYVYPPGTYFGPHSHAMDKIDAVLAGQFRISMQAESVVLRAGDAVYVPKNVEHSAEVVGTDPVVSLDAAKLS